MCVDLYVPYCYWKDFYPNIDRPSSLPNYDLTKLNACLKHQPNEVIKDRTLFWQLYCKVFVRHPETHHKDFHVKLTGDQLTVHRFKSALHDPNPSSIECMIEDVRMHLSRGIKLGKNFELVFVINAGHISVFDSDQTPFSYNKAPIYDVPLRYLESCLAELLQELQLTTQITNTTEKYIDTTGKVKECRGIRVAVEIPHSQESTPDDIQARHEKMDWESSTRRTMRDDDEKNNKA